MNRKAIIFLLLIILVLTPVFFGKKKTSIKITEVSTSCGVKAKQIKLKSNNVANIKCRFKNAGVLHNSLDKHGISAIVGELLCRKVGRLSPEETKEELMKLGIDGPDTYTTGDHFIISFRVLKSRAPEALHFLAPVFIQPEFTKSDLEFIKEKYPIMSDQETTPPRGLLLEKLLNLLYPNHNYGMNITGTAQAILSITESDVRDFVRKHFGKDNLEVFFTGDLSLSEVDAWSKILFAQLPKSCGKESLQDDIAKFHPSKERDFTIQKLNMKDIVGVICGVRLDGLTARELAAVYILAETLFNTEIGDFNEELRVQKITHSINDYEILPRQLSTVFYFWVNLWKNDLAKFQKYLNEKISQYPSRLNLKKLMRTRQFFIESTRCGFAEIENLDKKIKFGELPFEEVDGDTIAATAKKLFDPSMIQIVYIREGNEK
ncbi:MAG: insulinase family protein [Holosporaceae bacterium]|jgi:hypothetical protein|nr:insulinase family protein [Holosporaceae bacterium]